MTADGAELIPVGPHDAARFAWTERPPLRRIVAALEAARPASARFVGGCVRDSLIGDAPKDFDVATTLRPDAVIEALRAAGLGAAPTGIDHGTVTGVADHVGVEITTLRADVSTDGRRATVAFSEDWSLDARRRDFTINAVYLTADGKMLFDPVGGVADARAGSVRFIGAAADRIREDYLRILRFFRFSARFSQSFDEDGLAACTQFKSGVEKLSAERVGDEFSKILSLPRAPVAIDAMAAATVLREIWPHEPNLVAFAALKRLDPSAAAPLGLAVLWGERGSGLDAALRLSNADAARRRRAVAGAAHLLPGMTDREARARHYRLGPETWRDAVLVARAQSSDPSAFQQLATLPDRVPPPSFPISGKDIIAAGVEKGPAVSRILRAVEDAWIAEDFPPIGRLREILQEAAAEER